MASSEDYFDIMLNALQMLPIADLDEMEFVESWLEMQPDPAELQQPPSFALSLSRDQRRVSCFAAGDAEEFAPAVAGFLMSAGADEGELQQLSEAGAHLGLNVVGSWIEMAEENLDAGWYLPVSLPVEKGRAFGAASAVSTQLGEWARRCGAASTVFLRHSADNETRLTELVIPIPGADPQHAISYARQAFKMVGAPWFPPEVAATLDACRSNAIELVVGWTAAGLHRIGVMLPGKDLALMAHAVGGDAAAFKEIESVLDVSGPEWAFCCQYPWGFDFERFYVL